MLAWPCISFSLPLDTYLDISKCKKKGRFTDKQIVTNCEFSISSLIVLVNKNSFSWQMILVIIELLIQITQYKQEQSNRT